MLLVRSLIERVCQAIDQISELLLRRYEASLRFTICHSSRFGKKKDANGLANESFRCWWPREKHVMRRTSSFEPADDG